MQIRQLPLPQPLPIVSWPGIHFLHSCSSPTRKHSGRFRYLNGCKSSWHNDFLGDIQEWAMKEQEGEEKTTALADNCSVNEWMNSQPTWRNAALVSGHKYLGYHNGTFTDFTDGSEWPRHRTTPETTPNWKEALPIDVTEWLTESRRSSSACLPMVVMTVTEYSSASLNDQLCPSVEAAAVDGSMSSLSAALVPSRWWFALPLVAATIDPSNLRSCSCTSIVQLRSYNTLRRSAMVKSARVRMSFNCISISTPPSLYSLRLKYNIVPINKSYKWLALREWVSPYILRPPTYLEFDVYITFYNVINSSLD